MTGSPADEDYPPPHGYGSHSSEAEVRAEYDTAKRKVFEEGHGPIAQVAVAALWIIRQRSIRRLRKKGRREEPTP